MDKNVIMCLSSGLTPQYRLDILRVLALPPGASIQFRYGEDLIEPNLRDDLVHNARSGGIAVLSYVDCRSDEQNADHTCPIILCRYAAIIDSERIGSNFFITFELRDYPKISDPQILRNAFGDVPPHWASGACVGFWCFDATLTKNAAEVATASARLEAWQEIIKQLWSRKDFHDEPFFLVVVGIYERFEQTIILSHLKNGQYRLGAGRDYELQVLHVHPEGDQRKIEKGIGSVNIRFGEPTLTAITSSVLPIDSPYDLKRFHFRVQTDQRVSLSSIVISVLDKATEKPIASQPELYLPVRCSQKWWKPVLAAAFIGALLFSQQYVGLASKGPVDSNSAIASFVIAAVTAAFLVYGLKKPL